MNRFVVEGGQKLSGEIEVHGAKNSSLPILAATLLGNDMNIIHNCPRLSDVDAAVRILEYLGCKVERTGNTLAVDARTITRYDIPENLMREMRSSIVFLGAIISRMGRAKLSTPGGCELGPRPIDLHLDALQKLGVTIDDQHGYLNCRVDQKLRGTKLSLILPSVGATENIILTSVMAEGTTVINNAAQEPEIVDLAQFLNSRGARISGAGKSTIVVEGVPSLHAVEHAVIPDRIVAATYLCCGAVTGGELLVRKTSPGDLESILPVFEEMGMQLKRYSDSIYLKSSGRLKRVKNIRTMPHPGFPTDAQAPLMAVLSFAQGTSMFVENIFENRYKHVGELVRMGADIKVEGRVAVVNGVDRLLGAVVHSTDLRGGAALVVAGLGAQGTTEIHDIHHIDRGYEEIEQSLCCLGANIKRM